MTKVELHFQLRSPLDEKRMAGVAAAHSVYGILKVSVSPSLDGLTVEYDASRLSRKDVEGTLRKAGIPLL